MKKISVSAHNVNLPDLDFERIEQWVESVARAHNRILGTVNYVFCDDEHILQVNRQFLQHDYYTDIITFDYCMGRLLRGDLYISLDTVKSNSALVNEPYDTELLRVIIHGVLHLCGIDDKAPGARAVMQAHEDTALALYKSID